MPDHRGQFTLLAAPGALPGKCAGCGKAKCDEGFIDTGFDSDFWGVIYYCAECVADMASKFGYAVPEQVENLKRRIAELEQETITQRAAILGLEQAVDGLQQVRNLGLPDSHTDSVPTQSDSIIESEPEETSPTEESENLGDSVPPDTISFSEPRNSKTDNDVKQPVAAGISGDYGLVEFDDLF